MKNIFILFLNLAALSLNGQLINESFDTTNGGWTESSDSGTPYFEWGDPMGTQINDDNGGGGNAWVTGLSGDFVMENFEIIFLTSQAYDLSSLSATGSISFAINYDLGIFNDGFEDINDGVILEYSIDGFSWTPVGTSSSGGTNWYNDTMYDFWIGNSGTWITSSHDLPTEALGQASVLFRFVMFSGSMGGLYGHEGFAIDDFQIIGDGTGSGSTSNTEILTITLGDELFPATINSSTKSIKLFVDPTTEVTALAPTFTLSEGATVDKASGSTQDFSSPADYTVTSADGMTDVIWTISAVVPDINISIFPKSGILGTEISIYGRGFSTVPSENTVTFGDTEVTILSASANKLTFEVPSSASLGLNDITTSSNGLNSSSGNYFNVLASNVTGVFADYKEADFNLNASDFVRSMDVGDVDGDGDFDLVFDNETILNVSTLENGRIQSTVNKVTNRNNGSSSFDDITVIDINQDGLLDIIAGGSRLGWFKNNGDGIWADESIIDQNSFEYTIRVFDIDGDFDFDILTNDGASIYLFTNDGSGTFVRSNNTAPTKLGQAIDWDEDGDIDMLTTNSFGDQIIITVNDGLGNFTDSTLLTTGVSSLDYVQFGDLDNDGDQDLIYSTADFGASISTVGFILNNGDDTFSSENVVVTEGIFSTKRIELADLNNDGFLDIARIKSDGSGSSIIYYSTAPLTYGATETLDSSSGGEDLVLIDVDQDGDMDVLHEASQSGGYFPLFIKLLQDADITGFSLAEETGVAIIDASSRTISIEVAENANITSLSPSIDISVNASISPASNIAQDFSDPVSYTVTAEDGTTAQEWVVTVEQVPSIPVLSSLNIEQRTASVSWNETSAAVRYELELSLAEDFSTVISLYDPLIVSSGSTSSLSVDLENLLEGTKYFVRTRAQNIIDSYSGDSETISFITKPNDPVLTDVDQTKIGQDTISLSWIAVDGILDDYTVEVSLSSTFTTLLSNYPVNTASTTLVLGSESGTAPLEPNTTYWVRLKANNTTGASEYSNSISVLTKPETPVINTIISEDISQTTATTSWNSVFISSGSYTIEVSSTDFNTSTTLLSGYPQSVSSTSFAIGSSGTALETSTTYWVRLKSSNASGESPYSNTITFTTRPADPVLTDVALSDIGQSTVNLSWNEVSGSENYDVELSLSQTFTTLLAGYPANTSSTQLELGNTSETSALAYNTTYWVRILANNATGASGYSNAISVLTKPETPIVNTISNSNIGQTNANVSWSSVFSSGGSYNIEVSSTDFATSSTLVSGYPLSVSSTSINMGIDAGTSPLQTATNYWIRIRADNASGESPNSNVISFLTKPETPTALPATDVSTFSFTADWNLVSGADEYVLEVFTSNNDTKVFTDSTLLTSSQVTDLSEGIAYYYTVFAYNSSGKTPESSRISVTTNKSPTNLSLDNESVSENLSIGTHVGTFSTDDSDDTSHIYELVSGSGDTDNASFTIDGDQLITNQTFNAEDKNEYFVRVQTTDPKSASWSESFKIDIADANDAPTDISLETRNYEPTGYDEKGTVVAELLVTDEDEDKVTFELLEGLESFQIENTSANDANAILLTNKVFTNEVDSVLAITLEADDGKGGVFSKGFDITIKAFVDTEAPEFDLTIVNTKNFLIGGDFDSLALKAKVSDFRIGDVKLYTKLLTEVEFTSKVLVEEGGFYIDSIGEGDLGVAGIEYYFEATDDAGNSSIWGPTTVAVAFPQDGDNAPKVESVKKFGRTVSSYQIISIPFDFKTDGNKRVDVIFNEYSGGDNGRDYKIIKWDPDAGEIGELVPLETSSTIELGEGYFFIAAEEKSIKIENANINLLDPFPIVLKQGWNLIGNPYNLDIDWASIVDKNNANGIVGALRVLDPENPETWPESNILKELEGAFVEAKEDITLNIGYTDASISFGGGRKARQVKLPEAEWLLPITLSQEEDIRTGAIGMDKSAKLTLDKYDQLALPRWFEYLEISFMHHEERFKRYNRDIVPQAVSREWEFEVASSKNGPSTLSWDASSTNAGTLKLLNVQTGEILDMTQQSEYQLNLNGKASFRLLYSVYQDIQFDFDQISVLDAYPNPATASFTIPIRLPAKDQHQVQVSLLDLSGRKVWSSLEQSIDGGAQDMIISRPSGVAPGVYLYQVAVDNDRNIETFTRRITIQ